MPMETRGKCIICSKKSLLGNGLCRKCWDASIPDSLQNGIGHGVIIIRNLTLKKLKDRGISYSDIAKRYGLRSSTVKTIIARLRNHNNEG